MRTILSRVLDIVTIPVGKSMELASECNNEQEERGNTLSASEGTLSTAIVKTRSQLVQLVDRLHPVAVVWLCRSSTRSSLSSTVSS